MMITAGFWSYVHDDDNHDNGRIARLRERLERSIRFYSGVRDFRIFQDRKDIGWGEKWAKRISDSLDDTLLLFPVITPSYFSSAACREEVLAFRQRQAKLNRDDLILPFYYLNSDMMDANSQGTSKEEQAVATLLTSHQYEDWRSLRITEETDPSYGKAIERISQQAAKALKRGRPVAKKTDDHPKPSTSSDGATVAEQVATAESIPAAAPGHVMTLTVSQMPGRAQFTAISEAIARAPGGARILVSPGHYRENIVIDKPLELIGEGPREDIVIDAAGSDALIFDTNIGIFRNFTLRQSQNKNYCVWVKQGRLELEDCDISSSRFACLAVSNNADPRVRRNSIHHSGEAGGIFIYDQARGSYENNDIYANRLAGIEVKGAAEPIVRRNRLYDGKACGMLIGALGTYEDNEIFGNALTGVELRYAAEPLMRRNRVYNNGRSGVYIHGTARGAFEDNDIFGNTHAGFLIAEDGNPIVRKNRINKNGTVAIRIADKGAGSFIDNDLRENPSGAWIFSQSNLSGIKRERNSET